MGKRERGTGGLIKRQGSRYWYAQVHDAVGKPIRISTKKEVKAEAQGVLRNMMVDLERGVPLVSSKFRYEDMRTALIQNYVERGNKSLVTLTDGGETVWGLKAVDTFFKGYPVVKITTDAARTFSQKLLADGASNGTVNKSLALLRRMLSIAREDGKLAHPPKIRLLKAGAARKGFLPRDQFDKLLKELPANLKPLITFLYFCGVRLGEALQIDWKQVDLAAGLVRLESEQTKNAEARTVPLPDVLVGMLEMVDKKSGAVFDGTNLRKSWAKACVAAGLGTLTEIEGKRDPRYNGLIVHDLRRSAIRNLIKAGVNEKVAMTISGHKTRSVFDRYHIVDTEDVVEAMRRVQVSASSVYSGKSKRKRKLLKP
jgi:integrase